MSYITKRFETILSRTTVALASQTATQISGGQSVLNSTVAFNTTTPVVPSRNRQFLSITNCSTTAIVYIDVNSSVTSTQYWIQLAPGAYQEIDCDGSTILYAYGSGAANITVVELQ